jgi:hypothetical protein
MKFVSMLNKIKESFIVSDLAITQTFQLVALSDKSSHSTNQAFLQQVLSRFGVCVECLTNQGSQFRGEFQDLM